MSREQNAAAAARPDLRAPLREEPRTTKPMRRRKGDVDQFHIDASIIPDGMSWEWKTVSVVGKTDPYYQMSLADNGWTPVSPEKYLSLVPPGHEGKTIERSGLMLMERPAELTQEARDEDRQRALGQVRDNELAMSIQASQQSSHPGTKPSISSTIEVPD